MGCEIITVTQRVIDSYDNSEKEGFSSANVTTEECIYRGTVPGSAWAASWSLTLGSDAWGRGRAVAAGYRIRQWRNVTELCKGIMLQKRVTA